jgi:transcription elongation factor GreA
MSANQPILLTPEGKLELERELETLKTVRLADLRRRIQDLNEAGDVSDDSDFEDTKEELIQLESRIREIENFLSDAEIVEHEDSKGVVGFGSTVTVLDTNGEAETWVIVGPQEANPRQGRISNVSPVGRALLGKRVGEKIQVDAPGGTLVFEVTDVR